MSNIQPSLARLKELEVRLYRLTTKSHLAIGAGEAAERSPVDKPIIRALIYQEEERVPYLPASSLHGVIRAWVEKALRSLAAPIDDLKNQFAKFKEKHPDAAAWLKQKVCDDRDLSRDVPPEKMAEGWELWKEVCNPFWDHDKCEYLIDEASGRLNPKRLWLEHIGHSVPCQACSLFGHPGQRGRVRFTHAFPPPAGTLLDVITRVAINRYTGAADTGKLFDLEAVPPGVPFHFFIILENLSDDEKNRFDLGIKALNFNLANLGAFGTVGFGLVQLEAIRKIILKPEIFKLSTIPTLDQNQYPLPADFDARRFPDFFVFLARLQPNKELPYSLEAAMLEL